MAATRVKKVAKAPRKPKPTKRKATKGTTKKQELMSAPALTVPRVVLHQPEVPRRVNLPPEGFPPSHCGRPIPDPTMPIGGYYTYPPHWRPFQSHMGAFFLPFIDPNADTLYQFAQVALAYDNLFLRKS
ncbi:hypothetical protein TRVA0_006S04148 [Trichomonascus vanleenenianus]|uniref:uncharacterized protein n=1 Tax=Trichomonascus vanleenenianus TaxID=2268995 RepID=UPI003ECB88CA